MGSTQVGPQARREYLTRMRERYETAARATKSRLLAEVCEVTGITGKRRFACCAAERGRADVGGGGRSRYGSTVVGTLRRIWEATGYPWSLRLPALFPTWLPYATRRWKISGEVAEKLRTMSARQMGAVCAPSSVSAANGSTAARARGCCSSTRFR